jgi:hypothetical protein
MAEETEKKPKFILNKQKNESVPAQQSTDSEKKKVVVVKKKPAQTSKPAEKADGSKVTVEISAEDFFKEEGLEFNDEKASKDGIKQIFNDNGFTIDEE